MPDQYTALLTRGTPAWCNKGARNRQEWWVRETTQGEIVSPGNDVGRR